MHLKSLTLKGFKSFAERTRLDFGPGVSVIVGPNGSGKSNITDAVMWAMGEQSPVAVRGRSMQDVIFGGAQGVPARSSAEVELVFDNSDGAVAVPAGEISLVRRLDRSGEGEYRLSGARCRLADVMELLSDTGLGKETHSVISQGRVEAIVMSKPRERRMLIEEAAGLGKHRARRRKAQLKLTRTQENLDRALDVEREARTRLRPLKRQAEAAELHARLERQTLEAQVQLIADAHREHASELEQAEQRARAAREARAALEAKLADIASERGDAERSLAERSERHDVLAQRAFAARTAHERLALRGEQAAGVGSAVAARVSSLEAELTTLNAERDGASQDDGEHVTALEAKLAQLECAREAELERETSQLRAQAAALDGELERLATELDQLEREVSAAEERVASSRSALQERERAVHDARRASAGVGADLAAVNHFLNGHARARSRGDLSDSDRVTALSEALSVREGYELALAAVLGTRLDAALVADMPGASTVLDRCAAEGGSVLLAGAATARAAEAHSATRAQRNIAAAAGTDGAGAAESDVGEPDAGDGGEGGPRGAAGDSRGGAPIVGAMPLLELLSGPKGVLELAGKLLAGAWVVESLEDLPDDFDQIAVTPAGRVWFGVSGEVRQLTHGGGERVLAARNERDRLVGACERAAATESRAAKEVDAAAAAVSESEASFGHARERLLEGRRRRDTEVEHRRRVAWTIEQRMSTPAEGPRALERAQIEGELAAERRAAQASERERVRRAQRRAALAARLALDRALVPAAKRLASALEAMAVHAAEHAQALEQTLAADRQEGETMASRLRACAAQEAELQAQLRAAAESVTTAEVAAQRSRDRAQELRGELEVIAARLELSESELGELGASELVPERRTELEARVQRLQRRREQLGPVNPLASDEYAQALDHVQELEERRVDLEGALRELRSFIRETDRQIDETFGQTFDAAAKNFKELAGDVFPGGTGRLRLVRDQVAPRGVLGGATPPSQEHDGEGAEGALGAGGDAEGEVRASGEEAYELAVSRDEPDLPGVEIEITPAGKSPKRLSLLSGGEKSMTALAFLFAVFLAKPCPFYILDEVEAALDDLNLERFLTLLRRYSDRAQFIVITHQKRTMEAADSLYGVSMASDGVSKVLSRRLPAEQQAA